MQACQLSAEVDTDVSVSGRVHIVDDDELLRAALIRLVCSHGLDAVGHADAAGLQEALSTETPSCIVLDMRLERESGLAVQAALQDGGSTTPIIFLTGYGTIPMTVRAMRSGAAEFLTKPVDETVLLGAIHEALKLDACATLERVEQRQLNSRFATLTDRERQVMTLAIGGLMNKQIAGELGITEITAKVHKGRVMEKLCARSLPDLVRMAESLGVIAARRR
ncbi:response regulator [Sphingomonas sp. RB3P16]|uniref:response regulator transcription factor n=1 Tax=Parasphingomonas frigoris TaxID=3096163 RepID=UPI002FC69ACA